MGQAAVAPGAYESIESYRILGTLGTSCQSIQWIVNCSICASSLEPYVCF